MNACTFARCACSRRTVCCGTRNGLSVVAATVPRARTRASSSVFVACHRAIRASRFVIAHAARIVFAYRRAALSAPQRAVRYTYRVFCARTRNSRPARTRSCVFARDIAGCKRASTRTSSGSRYSVPALQHLMTADCSTLPSGTPRMFVATRAHAHQRSRIAAHLLDCCAARCGDAAAPRAARNICVLRISWRIAQRWRTLSLFG